MGRHLLKLLEQHMSDDGLTPSCKRCRYWDPTTAEEIAGHCTRNPPRDEISLYGPNSEDLKGYYLGHFPRTAPEQRCGEFLTSWPGSTQPDETPALDRIADALAGAVEMLGSVSQAITDLRNEVSR